MKKKEKLGKLKKKSNFGKKKFEFFFWKKTKKKEWKVNKKKGEESLWITVVIHSDLDVGEQWFPHTI